jgi:predicted O-methyltransferase YrrM
MLSSVRMCEKASMDEIDSYIANFITLDNSSLTAVSEQERVRVNVRPSIGPEVGQFLGLLIRLIQAKRVLEFGTSLGYSAIWLGEALRTTGGRLISIEREEELYRQAQKNLAAAGLSDVVELVLGDARTVVETLEGPFDLIFQDSDKRLYPVLLEKCIELTRDYGCIELTRDYGLIVADDALFKPLGRPDPVSEPIHLYNQKVFSDERLYSTLLPVGDGVILSVKLKN